MLLLRLVLAGRAGANRVCAVWRKWRRWAVRAVDKDFLLKHQRKVKFFGLGPDDESWGYAVPTEIIENAPTLTPPEIVYCQDCIHHEDGYTHWCNKWEHTCPDDSEFFCKFGRKKDGTTD